MEGAAADDARRRGTRDGCRCCGSTWTRRRAALAASAAAKTASRWSTSTSPGSRKKSNSGLILLQNGRRARHHRQADAARLARHGRPRVESGNRAARDVPSTPAPTIPTRTTSSGRRTTPSRPDSGRRRRGIKNPALDKMLEDARATTDQKQAARPLQPGPGNAGQGRGRNLGLHSDRKRRLGQRTRRQAVNDPIMGGDVRNFGYKA